MADRGKRDRPAIRTVGTVSAKIRKKLRTYVCDRLVDDNGTNGVGSPVEVEVPVDIVKEVKKANEEAILNKTILENISGVANFEGVDFIFAEPKSFQSILVYFVSRIEGMVPQKDGERIGFNRNLDRLNIVVSFRNFLINGTNKDINAGVNQKPNVNNSHKVFGI